MMVCFFLSMPAEYLLCLWAILDLYSMTRASPNDFLLLCTSLIIISVAVESRIVRIFEEYHLLGPMSLGYFTTSCFP